jgi:hypothetical protein
MDLVIDKTSKLALYIDKVRTESHHTGRLSFTTL